MSAQIADSSNADINNVNDVQRLNDDVDMDMTLPASSSSSSAAATSEFPVYEHDDYDDTQSINSSVCEGIQTIGRDSLKQTLSDIQNAYLDDSNLPVLIQKTKDTIMQFYQDDKWWDNDNVQKQITQTITRNANNITFNLYATIASIRQRNKKQKEEQKEQKEQQQMQQMQQQIQQLTQLIMKQQAASVAQPSYGHPIPIPSAPPVAPPSIPSAPPSIPSVAPPSAFAIAPAPSSAPPSVPPSVPPSPAFSSSSSSSSSSVAPTVAASKKKVYWPDGESPAANTPYGVAKPILIQRWQEYINHEFKTRDSKINKMEKEIEKIKQLNININPTFEEEDARQLRDKLLHKFKYDGDGPSVRAMRKEMAASIDAEELRLKAKFANLSTRLRELRIRALIYKTQIKKDEANMKQYYTIEQQKRNKKDLWTESEQRYKDERALARNEYKRKRGQINIDELTFFEDEDEDDEFESMSD